MTKMPTCPHGNIHEVDDFDGEPILCEDCQMDMAHSIHESWMALDRELRAEGYFDKGE